MKGGNSGNDDAAENTSDEQLTDEKMLWPHGRKRPASQDTIGGKPKRNQRLPPPIS